MTEPRRSASTAGELRLAVVTLLALTYVGAWWGFSRAPSVPAASLRQERVRDTVWYAELPEAARPVVQLPPGWRLASAGAVPDARRASHRRVRTRSS